MIVLLLLASLAFGDDKPPEPVYDRCRLAVVLPATSVEAKAKQILVAKATVDEDGEVHFGQQIAVQGVLMRFSETRWGMLYDLPFFHNVKSVWVVPTRDGVEVTGTLAPTGPNPEQTPLVPFLKRGGEVTLTDDGINGPMYVINGVAAGCESIAKK